MKVKEVIAAEKRKIAIQTFLDSVFSVVQDPSLPHAIITDLDGTLYHMVDRKFSEWNKVGTDEVDETIKNLILLEPSIGTKILVTSGRDEECVIPTVFRMHEDGIPHDEIFMRKYRDNRMDLEIKFEIFMNEIFGKYFIKYVLDDRQQVVDLWRKLGLKCLQVAPSPAD